jgi:hypothetical protein
MVERADGVVAAGVDVGTTRARVVREESSEGAHEAASR